MSAFSTIFFALVLCLAVIVLTSCFAALISRLQLKYDRQAFEAQAGRPRRFKFSSGKREAC